MDAHVNEIFEEQPSNISKQVKISVFILFSLHRPTFGLSIQFPEREFEKGHWCLGDKTQYLLSKHLKEIMFLS